MTQSPQWNFLTNHTHVLICLASNPEQPLREVAVAVGITERAVQRIVADLETAGYLSRSRRGRQNVYELHPELGLRHRLASDATVGDLMNVLVKPVEEDEEAALGDWTVGEHGSEIRN